MIKIKALISILPEESKLLTPPSLQESRKIIHLP
jgi:hypothetical protein